jgi:GMP synthase (glutamine-hydrolysing)
MRHPFLLVVRMAKKLVVFQHTPWEKPGRHMIQAAKAQKVRLDVWQAWHQPLPDIDAYDGLIVLGGTPNVDQEDQYPFLKAEKDLIRQALAVDMPYLGFCLGHQLLADALGAAIGPNFCCSVGFIHGQVTKDGRQHPLLREIPHCMPLFKWHSQAVLPPLSKEIDILVTSPECQIEAISVRGRPHIVGCQFDNYAAAQKDVREWVNGDLQWLLGLGIDVMKLLKDAEELESIMGAQFEVFFGNYLELISR